MLLEYLCLSIGNEKKFPYFQIKAERVESQENIEKPRKKKVLKKAKN